MGGPVAANRKEELRQLFVRYAEAMPEQEWYEFNGDILDWTSHIVQAVDEPLCEIAMRELLPEFNGFTVNWDLLYSLILLLTKAKGIVPEEVIRIIFEKKDAGILLYPFQELCKKDSRLQLGVDRSIATDMANLARGARRVFEKRNSSPINQSTE